MKLHIVFLNLFFALCTIPAFAQETNSVEWGTESHGLQMSISLKGGITNVPLGTNIVLTAKYKNVSTNTFIMYEYHGPIFDPSYEFKIISPSGEDMTPDMKKIIPSDSGAVRPITPGKIYEVDLNLSLLCKFDKAGAYKIVITKQIPDEIAPEFSVVSNPLNITVIKK